ncbi:MAG: PAS domain-containing sensor histidine kinase [Microbacterium sp.]|uniref:ATP-binding protein n=1 Tax=Microbacterium TaxID=33882 RepID=UPI0008DB1210|nr:MULTISPECIES: ATP-binding protein [Microbacterium]MAB20683.1 PAS domain-containing sensor histidine kinase [Microbacterium sp.]MAM55266.1 PAS domain-containing sensor histidine kinase [Microbacterium sp.]MAY50284.1 PAS domain-containing sensor histidine kinase [Microbacterium sp.]HAS33387.1 PAS domain-containing sensor histidine kinase [Microbacterium sp.]HBS73118.1 PAS domain-containing sensor histidine kinase [Microbacterium sp.]|tara:strand:+ start:2848 stop:4593 length:1746 start_codon:yes stop_codon:yes gene_type:complete
MTPTATARTPGSGAGRRSHPGLLLLPTLLLVVLALPAVWLFGAGQITDPVAMWSSVVWLALLEVAAVLVPWHRVRRDGVAVVPILAILAIGLFRVGTGGSASMFSVIILLPIVWVATLPGRRMVAFGIGALVVAFLGPYFSGLEAWGNGQLVRVVFVAVVIAAVAIVVNETTRSARARLTEVAELSGERARLLEEAERGRTELAAAAEGLRESEAFAKSIWEAMDNEAVIVTDERGRIVGWGPGAELLLGYDVADILGGDGAHSGEEAVGDLFVPRTVGLPAADDSVADEAEILPRLVEIGRSAGQGEGDLLVRSVDGVEIPVYLTCAERRVGDERVGYTFVLRDARHAKEITRLKDEFVGTISHELRTPLSSILGYLELVIEEEETLSEDQKRFIGVAQRNANRLLQLVGDLLFIAQVEAGKIPLRRESVDIAAIASAAGESILPVAERAGVAVAVHVPDAPLHLHADGRRIGQSIDNLVSNAVKFTPSGGSVTIVVGREDGHAVVTVTDTGMGIEPDDLEQLSERFFRSKMATRQAIKGVGLGLSITKAIVTAHDGTMSATSAVGEGTQFRIALPARPN